MRCCSTGSARAATSSSEGAKRPSISARARTASISAWLARGPGPQAMALASFGVAVAGPRRADEIEDRLDHQLADRHAADELLDAADALGVEHAFGDRLGRAGGLEQHAALGLAVGIDDVDLQEEAVELRLGQRVGALLLERVLGGEHVEGRGQVVADAGDGDVVFLHRLQQRRLGARAGAVDLVGHQELGEDRAADEAEAARLPSGAWSITSEPRMSEGIRSGVNWMRAAERPRTVPRVSTSLVLARPGTPTRRPWPPARMVISARSTTDFLTVDDLADGRPRRPDPGDRRLDLGDDAVGVGGKVGLVDRAHRWRLPSRFELAADGLHRPSVACATPWQ